MNNPFRNAQIDLNATFGDAAHIVAKLDMSQIGLLQRLLSTLREATQDSLDSLPEAVEVFMKRVTPMLNDMAAVFGSINDQATDLADTRHILHTLRSDELNEEIALIDATLEALHCAYAPHYDTGRQRDSTNATQMFECLKKYFSDRHSNVGDSTTIHMFADEDEISDDLKKILNMEYDEDDSDEDDSDEDEEKATTIEIIVDTPSVDDQSTIEECCQHITDPGAPGVYAVIYDNLEERYIHTQRYTAEYYARRAATLAIQDLCRHYGCEVSDDRFVIECFVHDFQ